MHSGTNKLVSGPRISIPLIAFAAVCLVLPIWLFGLPKGNDLPQHFQFALTFHESLHNGDIAPSLSASSNFGFGDVGVRFYPPASYLVIAVFRTVSGNWHDAAVLAFGLWFFLGGLGVYLWSREHFGEPASVAAAAAYMIAPYHVNELYNASLLAEFAAAGVLPFGFLFASRVCRAPGFLNAAGLAAAYALLILTHLPTAMIGSAGLAVFGLLSLERPNRIRGLISLGASAVGGLVLSSYYLVRVAIELPFVNHTTAQFIERAYDFRRNFLASYFYLPAEMYNDGSQWFGDMFALTAACLFVPSLVFYLACSPAGTKRKISAAAAAFVLGVFFATPLSAFVWENVSLLQKIQFPYRWLVLVNVAGAFLIAAGFRYVSAAFSSASRPAALAVVGLALVSLAFTAAQVIRPAIYVPKAEVENYVSVLSGQESYECWWAVGARDSAFANKQAITAEGRSVVVKSWNSEEKTFEAGPGDAVSVRIGLFYYPHWKASANGTPVHVSADEEGAMLVHLPAGPANVRVFFEEPVYARSAAALSAVSWLTLFIALLIFFVRNFAKYVDRYSNRKPV